MRPTTHRALLAAALSLVLPGLGQLYNGQLLKGLLVFFTAFLVVPYIYGIIDAYLVARRQMLPVAEIQRLLPAPPAAPPRPRSLEVQLVQAAQEHGGTLSVTEGVAATGRSFKEVEDKLDEMARAGYVDIGNRPDSGIVIYRFTDLAA
jgi:TM2 domain-containing membrane protein YozV